MKFLAIIQARSGSTRLPGKVLKDLCGKTALEQMLGRVQRSRHVDEIMVATTIEPADIEIVNLASGLGCRVYVGSQYDVLDRYYQAARLIKPEYVIRLTSDCPLFDWRILDEAIEELDPASDDLSMLSETFPDGQDLEIMRFGALERAWKEAQLASEREHVTLFIKNHPELFVLQDFKNKYGNYNSERWTLDEADDLKFIRVVYEHFNPNTDFSMQDIYHFLNENPKIRDINSGYIRNEGLAKSLKEDRVIEPDR